MVDFSTRRTLATAALAGALSLSACTAPAPAPQPDGSGAAASTAPPESGAAESGAAEPGATAPGEASSGSEAAPGPAGTGLEPVPYTPPQGGFDVNDPAAIQAVLAQDFIGELVTNKYTLSGQWAADGGGHANTAKLWDNRLSDNLKAKLTAAGKDGDVSGFGSWAVLSLPAPDSTEEVKASQACAAAADKHCLLLQQAEGEEGTMKPAGGPRLATVDQSVPNRVAFDYDIAVPVSLTGKDNAEGVMKGVLKVDLTYVPNPNAAAGGPEFLIDSIKNELTGSTTDVLAGSPGLVFESY